MKSKSGKTAVVFFVLIVVLLVSVSAISLYLLRQEVHGRKEAQTSLDALRERTASVEASLKEAQKQIEVLEGKNKDADAKINSLMDEIDLEAGLREEIKADNKKLKDALEAESKSKIEIRQRLMKELEDAQVKLKDIEREASAGKEQAGALQAKVDELQKKNEDLEGQLKDVTTRQVRNEIVPVPGQSMEGKVDLDRIVITPDAAKEGRVLNVDLDTEFLIFDMGAKHGIRQSDVMSIYRGKTYLGDVKVSRVQEEMAAADFIPPFSSRKVRKNDQVVPKR